MVPGSAPRSKGRSGPADDGADRGTGFDATDFASTVTAITAAFGDPSRRAIYLLSHERADGITASEAAAHFDLHPNVARHHLDKLASGGYLEVTVERPAGAGAGRPSKRYRSTPDQIRIDTPVRHDDLLATLLGRALTLLPRHEAEVMAEQVGVEYGAAMADAMGGDDAPRSFRAALHAVADALTAHGFAAHAEKRGGELRIVSEHCPFGATAVEHPVICAVDRGMVKGMLAGLYGDTEPATEASRPMGHDVCITAVEA